MTVLVTGASGFIGRHVVRELAGRTRVRAMVRDAAGAAVLEDVECELVRGDVTDATSLRRAVVGCRSVVHLAATMARPDETERVVAGGARALVDAARAAGIRHWVQLSALGTTAESARGSAYFRAKWDAEEAVRSSGMPHVVLRPSFVFGDDGGILPRFVRLARLSPVTPVVGDGRQRIQPIWVEDLARLVAAAAEAEGQRVVEVGGPETVEWNDLWRRIGAALGARRPLVHVPARALGPAAALLERLPAPLLTRDRLAMLQGRDNVVSDAGAGMRALGAVEAELVPLDEQLRRAVAAAKAS